MRVAREIMAHWGQSAEELTLTEGLIPSRNYAGLNLQNDQLRIWLPDPAKTALIEVCNRIGMSLTAYLTELFATYLYGIHEVMRMRDLQYGLYEERDFQYFEADATDCNDTPDDEGPEFDEPVPEMGKNIFALKIFVSSKLKAGLQQRADKAHVPLGRFARAMICAHLFGRDVGPKLLLAANQVAPD